MYLRLLRLFLGFAALTWGISVVGVFLSWSAATQVFERGIYDRTKALFGYFNFPFDAEPPPAPVRDLAPQPVQGTATIGRNDPCPCGSGKKYKRCCGKV